MASFQRLIITSDGTAADFRSICDLSPGALPAVNNFADYIGGLLGGNYMAKLEWATGAVQATGSIVSTGTATAAQTMKIANQTLTAKASGAVPADGEFNVSATPATQATSIALAINSMPELSGIVTAVAVDGTVTVTAVQPGVVGNGIELVDVDLANVAVTGMANGSDGTTYTQDLR